MNFIKAAFKWLLFRPWGVTFGKHSSIRRPFHVSGRKAIRIGERSFFLPGAFIEAIHQYAGKEHHPRIEVGDSVYVGRSVYMTAINRIVIGDGCVLSDYVYLTDEIHGNDPRGGPIMSQPLVSKGPVLIGPNCFLGFRVAVMPGVALGEHCIVGANSTVTRSFPAYSMIAGSPARLIKRYSFELNAWLPIPPDER